MTLNERIAWIKAQGWEYEIFETANNNLCLQAWPWSREMQEWEYTSEGLQVGKGHSYRESISQNFADWIVEEIE